MINLSLHALFLFSEKGSEKMTKYFTDSPYEKEMMEIPYIPMEITKKDEFRKSLSYHSSCKVCIYYSQGKDKCKRNVCPYLETRIKEKCITLIELISPIIYETKNDRFINRLLNLYYKIQGEKIMSMFKNDKHKEIFNKQISLYKKQGYLLSNRFTAALFVLTADSFIWKQSKYHIKPNAINFNEIDIRGIKTDAYLLFKVAKDFVNKTNKVSTSELADKLVTKEPLFKVIINGIIIARYGIDTVELELIPKGDKY